MRFAVMLSVVSRFTVFFSDIARVVPPPAGLVPVFRVASGVASAVTAVSAVAIGFRTVAPAFVVSTATASAVLAVARSAGTAGVASLGDFGFIVSTCWNNSLVYISFLRGE